MKRWYTWWTWLIDRSLECRVNLTLTIIRFTDTYRYIMLYLSLWSYCTVVLLVFNVTYNTGCWQRHRLETRLSLQVLMARYRFFVDIVETLRIYYFMLLEYVCKVSKLLTIQKSRERFEKNRLKMRLNMKFPMLRENWTTFSITGNEFFLTI